MDFDRSSSYFILIIIISIFFFVTLQLPNLVFFHQFHISVIVSFHHFCKFFFYFMVVMVIKTGINSCRVQFLFSLYIYVPVYAFEYLFTRTTREIFYDCARVALCVCVGVQHTHIISIKYSLIDLIISFFLNIIIIYRVLNRLNQSAFIMEKYVDAGWRYSSAENVLSFPKPPYFLTNRPTEYNEFFWFYAILLIWCGWW